ncbi:MAG: hypothetical protein QXJ07_05680 [Candidatus Bathyarchaeia archaeon]
MTVYICGVCGLGYSDWEAAKKCEEWCEKMGTCSIEITKKAVYFPNLSEKQNPFKRH